MNMLKTRMQQRGQGGFTLIELLVVIAILAILAGVVVFAVGNSTKNAGLQACKTERASIITAFAAAKTANLSKAPTAPTETYSNYLTNATLKYFDTPAANSPVNRINTTDVPDNANCGPLTATDTAS